MSALGRTDRYIIAVVALFTVLAGVARYGHWSSIVAFCFATVALAGLAHIVAVGVESVGELLVTALAMWQITGDGEAVAFEGLALIAIYLTLAGITLYETV